MSTPKVAFITAIYGSYEASCKPPVKQTIPTDFICFTNNPQIQNNGWIIDTTPYHLTNKSPVDTGEYINSIGKNNHTFNIAKYYKQNFQNIPRLSMYDVVIWLDGTLQIIHPQVSEWCLMKCNSSPIITWEHEYRSGLLKEEVNASHFDRYTSTFWFGQHQPYQDIDKQYAAYIQDGYDETFWKQIDANRKNLGVWITCFIAFNNKSEDVTNFLNMWYLQTLKYTTQDQIGFPYTVQKTKMIPYTLPDAVIPGPAPHMRTAFYIKHNHGR